MNFGDLSEIYWRCIGDILEICCVQRYEGFLNYARKIARKMEKGFWRAFLPNTQT